MWTFSGIFGHFQEGEYAIFSEFVRIYHVFRGFQRQKNFVDYFPHFSDAHFPEYNSLSSDSTLLIIGLVNIRECFVEV